MKRPPKDQLWLTITWVTRPDGYALVLRVRRLLKFALRVLDLKCVHVDWDPPRRTREEDEDS